MEHVYIIQGHGASRPLSDITFPLVHRPKIGARGLYFKVDGTGFANFPQRNFKVWIDSEDCIKILDGENIDLSQDKNNSRYSLSSNSNALSVNTESNISAPVEMTDAELKDQMRERFEALGEVSISVAKNINRGLVVYGAPGIGKSYEVVEAMKSINARDKSRIILTDENDDDALDDDEKFDANTGESLADVHLYHVQKGYVSPAGLYAVLYNHRKSNEILILDDCDGALGNEDSIGMLKAALDTTNERYISWGVTQRTDGLPSSFLYEGGIIFITNTNFERVAGSNSKIAPHVEAILSRCLYLDLMVETTREKLLRIDYVCRELGMLQRELGSGEDAVVPEELDFITEELIEWTHENANRFRDLSIRKMIHLAALRKSTSNWKRFAEMTILKGVR